jgi:competence protein ComGC
LTRGWNHGKQTTMKTPENKRKGFSAIESLVFLIALILLATYSVPKVLEIRSKTRDAQKIHAVHVLEGAKNIFDQDSKQQEKDRFQKETDHQRFIMLARLIEPKDPEAFARQYGLEKIRVGTLDANVEVE